jgi:hypothetical protein
VGKGALRAVPTILIDFKCSGGGVGSLRFAAHGEKPKIWYPAAMAKQKNSAGKSGKTGFVVGAAGFAKISAVEGIRLKPAAKKRAVEAGSKGLSAEETRKAIIRSYRKA